MTGVRGLRRTLGPSTHPSRALLSLALVVAAQGCALVYDFDAAAGGGDATGGASSASSASSATSTGGAGPVASSASSISSSSSSSSASTASGSSDVASSASSTGSGGGCVASCTDTTCFETPVATVAPDATVPPSPDRPLFVERLDATGAFVAAIHSVEPNPVTCDTAPPSAPTKLAARVLGGELVPGTLQLQSMTQHCVGSPGGAATVSASARGGNRALVAVNSEATAPLTLSWLPQPVASPDTSAQAFGFVVTLPNGPLPTQGLLFHASSGAVTIDRLTSLDGETSAKVNGWFALGTSPTGEASVTVFDPGAPSEPAPVAVVAPMAKSPMSFLFQWMGSGLSAWWSFSRSDGSPVPRAMTRENRAPIAIFEQGGKAPLTVASSTGKPTPALAVPVDALLVAETLPSAASETYELRLGWLSPPPATACGEPKLVDAVGIRTKPSQDLVAVFACAPEAVGLQRFVVQRFVHPSVDGGGWSEGWTRSFVTDAPRAAPKLALAGEHVLVASNARTSVNAKTPTEEPVVFQLDALPGGTVGFAAWLDADCGGVVQVASVAGTLGEYGVAGVFGARVGEANSGVLALGKAPVVNTITPVFNALSSPP